MKHVLSVQDLSCLGKCSLTVALPVLSAMGCAATALPTAVLSTHTAFPEPHVRDLTGDILPVCRHWHSIGAEFDAITVGYLSDPAQATAVSQVLDSFSVLTVLDPVMGDHGKPYSRITPEHVKAMKQLCSKAAVLLPNVTEAALLTGIPYRETAEEGYFRTLLERVAAFGPETVIITGAAFSEGRLGFAGLSKGSYFSYQADKIPKACHGTGDLFAAVFTGSILSGKSPEEAAGLSAAFVERVIQNTPQASPFGVDFETQLPWLWQQL